MLQRQFDRSPSQNKNDQSLNGAKLQKRKQPLQTNSSPLIDQSYLNMRQQIVESAYLMKINKHMRIRVSLWVKKLDKTNTNPVWKKNRNNYLKLLLLMIECENIVKPFNVIPPNGDLPHLSKHEQTQIIDSVEREVRQSSFKLSFIGQLSKFNDKYGHSDSFPEDQSSLYMKNFIQIAQNSNAYPQQKKKQRFITKNDEQDQDKLSQSNVEEFIENKQNNDINKKTQPKRSIISLKPSQVSQILTSAGPSYRLHNENKPTQFFSKNQRIKTTYIEKENIFFLPNFDQSMDNSLCQMNHSKQYDFNEEIDENVEDIQSKSHSFKENIRHSTFKREKAIQMGLQFLLRHHQILKEDETYKQVLHAVQNSFDRV